MRATPSRIVKLLVIFVLCSLYVKFRLQCKLVNDGSRRRTQKQLQEEINSLRALTESTEKEWLDLAKLNAELQRQLVSAYQAVRNTTRGSKLDLSAAFKLYEKISSRRPRNEYDVSPWNTFTFDTIHQLDVGYARQPAGPGTPDKRREVREVIFKAIEALSGDFKPTDLADGFVRIDRSLGTQYELFFRKAAEPNTFKRVCLVRALGDFQALGPLEVLNTRKRIVNIVLPVLDRVRHLGEFIRFFLSKLAESDFNRVFVTVVYFGKTGYSRVRNVVQDEFAESKFSNFLLLDAPGEKFSRVRGLQIGASHWNKPEVPILLLADVDLRFDKEFLERCRTQARMGRKVYYPIPFRLYNPRVAFLGKPVPPIEKLLHVHHKSGFWDDWDFTPSCQYR